MEGKINLDINTIPFPTLIERGMQNLELGWGICPRR